MMGCSADPCLALLEPSSDHFSKSRPPRYQTGGTLAIAVSRAQPSARHFLYMYEKPGWASGSSYSPHDNPPHGCIGASDLPGGRALARSGGSLLAERLQLFYLGST
jgi:hypothetical protein